MSKLMYKVNTFLSLAECKTNVNFKNAVKLLEEIIQSSEIINEITNNSKTKDFSATNWHKILLAVHRLIIYEAEKYNRAEANNQRIEKRIVDPFILMVILHGNDFLRRIDLLELILEILNNNAYKYYHDTYLSILKNYFTTDNFGLSDLSIEQWLEVLNVCHNLYKKSSSSSRKQLVLSAMQKLIWHGCIHTNLVLKLKRFIPFLGVVLQDVWSDESILTKYALEFVYTFCVQISLENRNKMCTLGIEILPEVLHMRECQEKHKLLLFFIQIYHPNGITVVEYGDNYDKVKWNSILNYIYQIIMHNMIPNVVSDTFIELATEVFKQILENPKIVENYTKLNYSTMTTEHLHHVTSLLDILGSFKTINNYFLIQIVVRLLKKYPECLKVIEYKTFLHITKDFFIQYHRNESIAANLCNLGVALLQYETKNIDFIKESEEVDLSWTTICEIVLTNIDMNKIVKEGHSFIYHLITNGKHIEVTMFLNPYIIKTILMSPTNVESLYSFCKHVSLQNMNNSSIRVDFIKSRLLEWILDIPWQKLNLFIPVDHLSKLLLYLTLDSYDLCYIRNFYTKETNIVTDLYYEIFDEVEMLPLDLIAKYHLSLQYNKHLLDPDMDNQLSSNKILEIPDTTFLSTDNVDTSVLTKTLMQFLISEGGNECNLNIHILKTAILAKVISDLQEANIMSEEEVENFELTKMLKESLLKISEQLQNLDPFEKDFSEVMDTLEALNTLYTHVTYNEKVTQIIISTTSLKMIKHICSFINLQPNAILDSKYDNAHIEKIQYDCKERIKKQNELSKRHSLKISSIKILTSYCCLNLSKDESSNTEQMQILFSLLNAKWADFSSSLDIKIMIKMLTSFANCETGVLNNAVINFMMNLVIRLFQNLYKETKIIRSLLCIMPHICRHVSNSSNFSKLSNGMHNLLQLFYNIHKCIAENKYGPIISLEFIICLSKIVRQNDSGQSLLLCYKKDKTPFDIMSIFVQSPFYMVRFETARCLYFLFTSKEAVDIQWKMLFFLDFSVFFLVKENEDDDDIKMMKVASMIYTIIAIIYGNIGQLRSKALLLLFKMKVEVNLDTTILLKVLKSIESNEKTPQFINRNLSFLMTSWLKQESSFNKFPWTLLGCLSEKEFYSNYCHILFPQMICNEKYWEQTIYMCKTLEFTFPQMIERNFASIMPWFLNCYCEADSKFNVNALKDKKKIQPALNLFEQIKHNEGEFSSIKKYKFLLEETVEYVLINVVKRLYDEEHFVETFGYVEDAQLPNQSVLDLQQLTSSKVRNCLLVLKDELRVSKDNSLIRYMITKYPNRLQKILMDFTYEMKGTMLTKEWQIIAFHQYTYFCSLIGEELHFDYMNEMCSYIIRDISYTLIHLIRNNSNLVLSELACKYLYQFLKYSLPSRVTQIKEYLNLYVTCLVTKLKENSPSIFLETLKFLIVDQKDILKEEFEGLDPLPNYIESVVHNSHEHDRRLTLEDEIDRFLRNNILTQSKINNIQLWLKNLTYLKHQLTNRRQELMNLYEKLQTLRGFTEDCTESVLHRLIHRLVKFTNVTAESIRTEAARCLALLGPMNLNTMALYPDKSFVRDPVDSMAMLTYRVISLLSNLMIEDDFELRKVSNDAMCEVFAASMEIWVRNMNKKSLQEFESNVTNNKPSWYRDEFISKLRLDFVYPFTNEVKRLKTTKLMFDATEFNEVFCCNNDLWTKKSTDYSFSQWITEISSAIASCFINSYIKKLLPIFQLSVQFCEETLPRIIYLLIRDDKTNFSKLCDVVNVFFRFHVDKAKTQATAFVKHNTIRCLLNVVNYIRAQDNLHQLQIDQLKVAQAAQQCSAYFTAAMYAELWCEKFLESHPVLNESSVMDHIYYCDKEKGKIVHDIIRQVYVNVGIPDMIYGCSSLHWQEKSLQIQYYKDTDQWDKVILAYDIELFNGKNAVKELLHGLHQLNLHNLLKNFTTDFQEIYDFEYESAWRLVDWNSISSRQKSKYFKSRFYNMTYIDKHQYSFYHYKMLKCFHECNGKELKMSLSCAQESVLKGFQDISFESSSSIYPSLMKLQMLHEIELLSTAKSLDEILETYSEWQKQDTLNSNDIRYIEPIFSQRIVMIQLPKLLKKKNSLQKELLVSMFLKFIEITKQYGRLQNAVSVIETLNSLTDLPQNIKHEINYQQACLAWKTGNLNMGRQTLSNLLATNTLETGFRANCLQTYATWVAEMGLEHPREIMKNYYLESIQLFKSKNNFTKNDRICYFNAQATLARFADMQYKNILEYMQSWEFKRLQNCMIQPSLSQIQSLKNIDVKKAVWSACKQNKNDKQELQNLEDEKKTYLLLAVKYYAITLQNCDEHNFLIFRLVSLWLDNTKHEKLNAILDECIHTIPSYKFIPLIPQLSPHVTDEINNFSTKIIAILNRCSVDHPYHTVPILLALKHLYKDREYEEKETSIPLTFGRKIAGVTGLINQLKLQIGSIICETEKLFLALISLAYLQVKSGNDRQEIPRNQDIRKILNLNNVLVPTLTIKVEMNAKYNNIVSVFKYDKMFENVGGINAPKKVFCTGSDGIIRPQLIKGRDDLRQDAVMQQVFSVINSLLQSEKITANKKLHVRTYKVVPLSQRSGVLEWCENTNPINIILVGSDGKSGVHKKYYPEDYTAAECRQKMLKISKATSDRKYQVYENICKHLHPAFHYFFLDTYQSPEIWFERKLAYTRSVATSSIVGYILGIGDRHLNNILLDKVTGEVIHIDFGIAFEQGALLEIPETIPFRLTRDIEAAMGVYGAKGTMRRFCEETMSVLRQQHEIITMLLQVLLYDPLYIWEITAEKALSFQSNESSIVSPQFGSDVTRGKVNKMAERALLRIQQKLQGTEEGVQSTIAGQIDTLIQQARDPIRLSCLFCGWQPFL